MRTEKQEHILTTGMIKGKCSYGKPLGKMLRCCGLVVDPWLWDQEVLGSSPGYARSTLSPWERLFT